MTGKRIGLLVVLMFLLTAGLYAERCIIAIRMDDVDLAKSNRFESMRILAGQGVNILYYNELYAVAEVKDDTLQHLPSCIKLASLPPNNALYLVHKIPGLELNTSSTEFRILMDLGSSHLIDSALDDIILGEIIQSPYSKLNTDPIRFPVKAPLPAFSKEFRTDIAQLVSFVNADSVEARLYDLQNFVTRHALADNRLQVAEWIRQKFISYGISNAELQAFDYNGTQQNNVVATIPGTVYPDEYIIVGGHHDSRSTDINDYGYAPGADDNASGTVAALEMARVISQYGYQPPVSIRFVTFACEELGLWGSKHYSQTALDNEQNIRLMINHDMIANNTALIDRPVKIMPYDGALDYADYALQLTSQYTDLVPEFGPYNYGGSDQISFWQKGFNTLFFNEAEFSPVYHSPEDVVANLDPVYCAEVIKASLACTVFFADIPGSPEAPLAVAATDIYEAGFTANWESVNNADIYLLDVYTKDTVALANDLFFSEYIEGSGYNKAIEIFNGTGIDIDLGGYIFQNYAGNSMIPSRTLALSGPLANGDVLVLVHPYANAEILSQADITSSALWFDGDDQLALYKLSNGTFADVFGRIGEDPGSGWGLYPLTSLNRTLVRKNHITGGISENPADGFLTLATEWYSYPVDTGSFLGNHSLYQINFLISNLPVDTESGSSLAINGLLPDTEYYYVVRAENDYFTSGNSNEIAVRTLPETTLPVELSSFSATVTQDNYVQLAWEVQSETGLTGYSIRRNMANDLSGSQSISSLIPAANTSQAVSYCYTDTDLVSSGIYFYWLQVHAISGEADYFGPVSALYSVDPNQGLPEFPLVTELQAVYPNPFNPVLFIPFSLAADTEVRITIQNIKGQLVRHYDLGQKTPGHYRVTWDGKDSTGMNLGSGVYYVTLIAEGSQYNSKALLLK